MTDLESEIEDVRQRLVRLERDAAARRNDQTLLLDLRSRYEELWQNVEELPAVLASDASAAQELIRTAWRRLRTDLAHLERQRDA